MARAEDQYPIGVTILGRYISIEFSDLYLSSEGNEGDWDPRLGLVRLQGPSATRSVDWVWRTLGHELAHATLDLMGETKLSANEDFVDLLGAGIADIIRYREYEEDEDGQDS